MIKRGYKRSFLVINMILILALIFSLLNVFVFKNYGYIFPFIFLLITFIVIAIPYGFEKKNKRFTYESMFYIFSYTIIFLIITYILGIFTGFSRTIYTLSFYNLRTNILPYILLILSGELLRSEIVRKCDTSLLAYILVTILMVIVDCTLYILSFDLATADGQIKYICYIVLPSISKNCLLLYITRIGGHYPSMIYRFIMELRTFIIPIEPNFGMYIESVLYTSLPALVAFATYMSLKQYENKEVEGKNYKKSKLYIYASVFIISTIVVTVVILTSCKFKYGMLAIGSGSMTGTIDKGDAVIYETIDKNKNKIPKKGDIMVFRKENRIIVHRVIRVESVNKTEKIYYTKGDANKTEDGYPIEIKQIVGVVKNRIKYIGLPSVALYELTTKK